MKHFFFSLLLLFPFYSTPVEAQNSNKEWVFVNKKNGNERVLKKDKKVTVYWQSKKREEVSWGNLSDISSDSLFLVTKKSAKRFAKKDIRQIRHRSGPQRSKGFGLIFLGICVMGLALLAQVVSNASRLDVQLAAGEKELYWPWALAGIGFIIWGSVLMKSPIVYTSEPFSEKWSVYERSVEPPNQP